MNPQPGQYIELAVRLRENDTGNDDLADATERIPYEAGWRYTCDTPNSGGKVITTGGSRVQYTLRFCLEPIR